MGENGPSQYGIQRAGMTKYVKRRSSPDWIVRIIFILELHHDGLT